MQRVRKRASKQEVLSLLDPLIAEWFDSRFEGLTEPQAYAIPLIHERKSVLVSSPTGSGKTLTAFTSIINELFKYAKEGRLEDRIYAVYVSPLKALANDINKNLEEPLGQMHELATRKGYGFPQVRVGVRSGDTSPAERQRQLRKPPHIFITTPESLALVLTAPKFREKFSQVEYVIVDEIHEICDSKRGAHLSLTLERLQALCQRPITRIGLSATLAPIEDIAAYLMGCQDGKVRPVEIIEVLTKRDLDLEVMCPTEDMTALPYEIVNARMYDMLRDMVNAHRTTLVFTNTRSGTEQVVYKLRERGIESIEAHHGSLSKETRLDVEDRLKRGELRCVVSSTSLELGIDIGSVDLVCQIGSPKSVAKGLQRIGRSGHSVGRTPKGRMIVLDLDDLVECAVLCRAAHRRAIDRVTVPENALDVLAQTLVGMSLERRWTVEEALRLVRGSYCYRGLSEEQLLQTLRYLGSKDAFEGVYSKLWYDPEEGAFGKKKGARMIYFLNLGTIPEEAAYKVFNERGGLIGDLSEKFVERLSVRDVFVLGGRPYEFVRAKGMRVYVRSAPGRKPTVPSWTGEMLPRSFDLSMEIARFRGEMEPRLDAPEGEVVQWLMDDFSIDHGSALSLLHYFKEQRAAAGVPNQRHLLVEGYLDAQGNSGVIFHFPFGRRVNDALSRAYAFLLTQRMGCNISVSISDDAFLLMASKRIDLAALPGLLRSGELRGVLRRAVKDSEIFKQRFRHVAARSFMVLRNYKGREVSVNRQQVRSQYLLDYLAEQESVPVIEETYREVLEDVMDIQRAEQVVQAMEAGEMTVTTVPYSPVPSPFGHSIVLAGISDIVMMEDRSSLLRELHRRVLSKVLGEGQRFQFEDEAVSAYFRAKRGIAEDKETLFDLIARAGPFHIFREKGRSVYPYCRPGREQVDEWASELLAEGRIASVHLDDVQYVAAEHLPTYASLSEPRAIGAEEAAALALLREGRTAAELEAALGKGREDTGKVLRALEAQNLVGRVAQANGRFTYRARAVPRVPRERAVATALLRHLEHWAPATADEAAFALHLPEEEVRRALRQLTEDGLVEEGRFVTGEQEQYMLKRDHLRLRHGSEVFDHRTVDGYQRAKLERQFDSVEECLHHFGEMGLLYDIGRRVKGFDLEEWRRLREDGTVLSGRFVRGRVRYVLREDAPMYVKAYRTMALSETDQRVLRRIRELGGASMRELAKGLPDAKETIKDSLDRLDRNMYIVRRYEEGEDWSRENVYEAYDAPEYEGDPAEELVRRFVRAYGPVPPMAVRMHTGLPPEAVEGALDRLGVERIVVGDAATEMVLMADELDVLRAFSPPSEEWSVVSPYDPAAQPHWADINARFGDSWVFPVLRDGTVVGGVEKWDVGGCVELRAIDLDEPSRLPMALQALEPLLRFQAAQGLDMVRVKEVLGVAADEVQGEAAQALEAAGFVHLEGMWARGGVPRQYEREELLRYAMRRQGLLPRPAYPNVIEGVKRTGGFRGDPAAFARCRVKVPLKRMVEQGLLYVVTGLPEHMMYTSMQHASLYRDAKARELSEDAQAMIRMLERNLPMPRRAFFERSVLGPGRTQDALRELVRATVVAYGRNNRITLVPSSGLDAREARLELLRLLFRNFGTFTAENLSRYLRGEVPMRELRSLLAQLTEEGFLAKGFLERGSDAVHWALKEDLDGIGRKDADRELVLYQFDNMAHYLYDEIRERCGGMGSLVMRGPHIIGCFRSKHSGRDLTIIDLQGGREAKEVVKGFVSELGWTVREKTSKEIPDWEIQEFLGKVMGREG
ncbi:MAG TPA: ATP-dependent helicase [Methanomassiliicoccales archaeon]|nr:ATP-dependent helicase [Methanomassiliicoccales archaeon]HQM66946.1 ATP-dependent helicase [Methanomassiliicoccales archaeon]